MEVIDDGSDFQAKNDAEKSARVFHGVLVAIVLSVPIWAIVIYLLVF